MIEMDPHAFWFRNDSVHMLFTASFDMKKDHFSGLLVFNPLPENGYRMVFMTEFGLKIFDMEYASETGFVVHYCIPSLNRRFIISLLQNDLGLLPGVPGHVQSARILYDRKSDSMIMQVRDKGTRYDCFIGEGTNKVYRIIRSSRLFRKVQVDYFSSDGTRLDAVSIAHYHIKLNIKLSRIDEITAPADGQAL